MLKEVEQELEIKKELDGKWGSGRSWARARTQEGAVQEPRTRKDLGRSRSAGRGCAGARVQKEAR